MYLTQRKSTLQCGDSSIPFARALQVMRMEHEHRELLRRKLGDGTFFSPTALLQNSELHWTVAPPLVPFYGIACVLFSLADSLEENEAMRRAGKFKPWFWLQMATQHDFGMVQDIWRRAGQNKEDYDFRLDWWLGVSALFESTLPRDRLYALLGMSTSADREAIKIDYSGITSDGEVFAAAASHILKAKGSLEYLERVQYRPTTQRLKDLPSWAYDISDPGLMVNPRRALYHAPYEGRVHGALTDGGKWTWFRLCPPIPRVFPSLTAVRDVLLEDLPKWLVRHPQTSAFSNMRIENDQKNIIIQGLRVDTIYESYPGEISHPSLSQYKSLLHEVDMSESATFEYRWAQRFQQWHAAVLRHPFTACRYSNPYEAFWRTLAFDQVIGDKQHMASRAPDTTRKGYEIGAWIASQGSLRASSFHPSVKLDMNTMLSVKEGGEKCHLLL